MISFFFSLNFFPFLFLLLVVFFFVNTLSFSRTTMAYQFDEEGFVGCWDREEGRGGKGLLCILGSGERGLCFFFRRSFALFTFFFLCRESTELKREKNNHFSSTFQIMAAWKLFLSAAGGALVGAWAMLLNKKKR